MSSTNIKELLEKYMQGNCTPAEEAFIYEWLDSNDADDTYTSTEAKFMDRERRIWRNLQKNLPGLHRPSAYHQLKTHFSTIYKYAAVAVLLLAFTCVFNTMSNGILWWTGETYSTAFGEIKEISLTDGSVVTLNAMSVLKVPADYNQHLRNLYLDGEAYFKVRRDAKKAFLVYANGIETKALGTEFNVSAYKEDGNTVVSLKKGKVEVKETEFKERNEVILNPGEEASIGKNLKLIKGKFSDYERLGWRDDQALIFKNADMEEVLGKLRRHYGVVFNASKLKNKDWKLTGEFKAQSLTDVLESLSFNYNLKYTINDKEVTLTN